MLIVLNRFYHLSYLITFFLFYILSSLDFMINIFSILSLYFKFNNKLIAFDSFKSQSYISVQEEYRYEDPDEGLAFLERRIYTLSPW